jgi:hypothetical protein
MTERHILTAEEVLLLDEINADKMANEQTFKIALNYHNNRASRIHKHEVKMWRDLVAKHGLDATRRWAIDTTGPIIYIKVLEDEDG